MLIPIFEEHNWKIEELGSRIRTLEHWRYKTSLKHTKDFLHWNYIRHQYWKIDYAFITEYEFYLRSAQVQQQYSG
jgi:hypothetical protein